jgi:YrbI family 3-deoxy-D-manno-octulosonate 8-phosphate phosphatase
MSQTICIIPARGGSKGLPRKNVLPLCGRPLIAWNILAALEACGGGNVYVTTDDAEIASVGKRFGARIVQRPAELADDGASSESALLHALDTIRTERELPEFFLFLQCTSPLTDVDDIRTVMELMKRENADSALSATASHRFLWKPATDGSVGGVNHDPRIRQRRQDRAPEFAENGAIYAMRTAGFLDSKHRFFGKTVLHAMPEERSWEIDSLADFRVAGEFLRERLLSQRTALLPSTVAAVVFDFDGVMTDNRVHTAQDGTETVTCDRSDGLGIASLRASGIPILVLSTEENPVVAARCRKMKIECIHGVEDKAERLKQWLIEHTLDTANVIYLGNDRNDSKCLELVGCPVSVADAYPEAIQRSLIILDRPGGKGAVRELCDLIVNR